LNITHKNPFDRFLIAPPQADGMVPVLNEALFDTFAGKRLW
jgi:PIN domain nuclease of toxin-antitoxin system